MVKILELLWFSLFFLNMFWILYKRWGLGGKIVFIAFLGYKIILSYYYIYSLVETWFELKAEHPPNKWPSLAKSKGVNRTLTLLSLSLTSHHYLLGSAWETKCNSAKELLATLIAWFYSRLFIFQLNFNIKIWHV